MSARRTKRRYAHELYPHAEEWQTRPLAVEVPYLYSQAIGLETSGTGWMDLHDKGEHREPNYRIYMLIDAQRIALLADALSLGMTGDEAWVWADRHDVAGEWVWERAVHYGVDPDRIKPHPCGPEPEHHDHHGPKDARGGQRVTRVDGKESDCPDCTEPVTEGGLA